MSYVFFTVQNAAFTIVQKAANSAIPQQYNPTFDLVYDLAPLEKINSSLIVTTLATQCQIQVQSEQVLLTLRYPMIIWVPLLNRLWGQRISSAALSQNLNPNLLKTVFQLFHLPSPSLTASIPSDPYVHWFVVSASALDENSVPNTASPESPI